MILNEIHIKKNIEMVNDIHTNDHEMIIINNHG